MQAATQIARKAIDLGLVAGRSPISIAAAAIYMASSASDVKKSAKSILVYFISLIFSHWE